MQRSPAPVSSGAPVVLNGRAAVRRRISGVERWALELLPRLKALAPERYVVLTPRPALRSRAAGHAWEQLVLPAAAARLRATLIFSPANLAPLIWPRNVIVIHDAAALRAEGSYARAYRTMHAGFEPACARRALRVVTVSEFCRGELAERAGVDPENVVVIHGGVNGRFRPDADPEPVARRLALKAPYVLTVGTADRRKNLTILDSASRRLRELGVELVWAGGSRAHIRREASIDGLRPLGYVEDEYLPGLYAGAQAFVLPSRYEGFGLPCIEAMACGTPVVAAARGALPEVCGPAALLVDPDDPDAVADAVVRAATEDGLRAQLCESGLGRAAELTWDRAAAEVDALLRALAR